MCTEDSPSGLWRTLGKRVGCKPSGVRIPHPPPPDPGTCPGSGVFFAFAAKSPHRRGGALLQRIRVFPLAVELEGKNRGTRYEISTTRRGGRRGTFLLLLLVVPLVFRAPERTGELRDTEPGCGARGRRQGLAGLRGDAPSEARGADDSRAGRRPRAHQAARPTSSSPAPTAAGASSARNTDRSQPMFHVKHLPIHRPRYPVSPGKWHT